MEEEFPAGPSSSSPSHHKRQKLTLASLKYYFTKSKEVLMVALLFCIIMSIINSAYLIINRTSNCVAVAFEFAVVIFGLFIIFMQKPSSTSYYWWGSLILLGCLLIISSVQLFTAGGNVDAYWICNLAAGLLLLIPLAHISYYHPHHPFKIK